MPVSSPSAKAIEPPPPVIGNARVIAYAIVDESVTWTGRQALYRDGKEVGPVPCIALMQDMEGKIMDTIILHCDSEWEVVAVSGAKTFEDAKARVERAYNGINQRWRDGGASLDKAKEWVAENYEYLVCLFCGRSAAEMTSFVTKGAGSICGTCIDELHSFVHDDDSGSDT
jgi:hypothetical protein